MDNFQLSLRKCTQPTTTTTADTTETGSHVEKNNWRRNKMHGPQQNIHSFATMRRRSCHLQFQIPGNSTNLTLLNIDIQKFKN